MPFEHAGHTFGVYRLEPTVKVSELDWETGGSMLAYGTLNIKYIAALMVPVRGEFALPKPTLSLRWTMRLPLTFGLCLLSGAWPLRFTATPCVRVCSS